MTDDQLSEVTVSEDWPDAAAAPMDDPGDDEPEELEGDERPRPEEMTVDWRGAHLGMDCRGGALTARSCARPTIG